MGGSIPQNLQHHIRKLAGLWRAESHTDADLLTAFVAGDETAFTALVVRHGRLVWAACRRVLGNSPDVEDAFQAVFIALARQARKLRRQPLAGWLYQVAHRAALDVRKAARRRAQLNRRLSEETRRRSAPADAEAEEDRVAVAEELVALPEKLRGPLILYYLEGKTQAEVGQSLGISDRAVAGRLERGLTLLRERLGRRGLAVTASSLATLLAYVEPAAAVSARLLTETARLATAVAHGAPASVPAATIAAGLTGSRGGALLAGLMAATKLLNGKITVVVLLLLVTAVLAGKVALDLTDHPPPVPTPPDPLLLADFPQGLPLGELQGPVTVRGRVLDDTGRPVPHAQVALLARRSARGEFGRRDDVLRQERADAGGRFAFELPPEFPLGLPEWRQVKLLAAAPGRPVGTAALVLQADMPPAELRLPAPRGVHGRLFDADNQPVAGVAVHVVRVGPVDREPVQGGDAAEIAAPPGWPAPAVTDAQGRFELAGVDPRQGIALDVRDERFARQRALLDGRSEEGTLTIRLAPPQVLEGQVLAADTGQPLPYARLSVGPCDPPGGPDMDLHYLDARADAHGRFRVQPLPGDAFEVYAFAPDGEPYLTLAQQVRWPAGTWRQELTLRLPRGLPLHGQVVEVGTGRPVAGARVQYLAHQTQADVPKDPSLPRRTGAAWTWSGPNGRFVVPAKTGRGLLVVHVPRGGYLVRPIDAPPSPGIAAYASAYAHAALALDLPANCREHEVRIDVQPVGRLQGRVLDAAGQPLQAGLLITAGMVHAATRYDGARCFPLREGGFLREGVFTLPNTDPSRGYPVVVLDAARERGTFAVVLGRASAEPPILKLQDCGRAEGRLLDRHHRPLPDWPIELAAVLPHPSPGRPKDQTEVRWYAALKQKEPLLTDAAGRFTLPTLVPGVRYRLYAVTDDARRLAREFTLTAGQVLQLDGVVPTD